MNQHHSDSSTLRFKATAWSVPIIVGTCLLGCALSVGGYFEPTMRIGTNIATSVLFLLLLLFGTHSIRIYDDVIILSYGIGLIRRMLDVHTLNEVRLVQNRFLSALYNMRAEHVVQVSDRFGHNAIIGVGEPRETLEFIRSRIRR